MNTIMKKTSFVLICASCIFLSGCYNRNVFVKPKDFDMDYWIGESVYVARLDESRIWKIDSEDTDFRYVDSHYDFQKPAEGSFPTGNQPRVEYGISFVDNNWAVTFIAITDPNVSVYGLTFNSNWQEVHRRLRGLGFKYKDGFSGIDPYYCKQGVSVTVGANSIQIEGYYA